MKRRSKKKKKIFLFILSIVLILGVVFEIYKLMPPSVKEQINSGGISKLIMPKVKIVDENSKSRPIAVMINNNHAAWPHAGLQDAYLSYEIIAEGGITRIMALFKDQNTAKIGSVRSSRHYYLDYALENDAIYVHYGWSNRAKSDIASLGVDNINGLYDSGFWRDTSLNKSYEHTAFTSIKGITKTAKSYGYLRDTNKDLLLKYNARPINNDKREGSKKADVITIKYSDYHTTSYEYDPEKKVYLRSMSGEKHVDAITNKQYTVKNIIVYKVSNSSFDSYGRQDLDNIGKGKGYFITNGYAVPITWEKKSRSSQTVYRYLDNEEIVVNDGNTFIQIQPKGQPLSIKGKE